MSQSTQPKQKSKQYNNSNSKSKSSGGDQARTAKTVNQGGSVGARHRGPSPAKVAKQHRKPGNNPTHSSETKSNRSNEPRRKEKVASGTSWVQDVWPLLKIAGHIGSKIVGFGDYEVKRNSLMAVHSGGKIGGEVPIVDNGGNSNLTAHREYIGPVMGSTDPFSVVRYPLNFGMNDVFPWFSGQANLWTRAKWHGAIVEYIPLSSDYSATSALGSVMLGTQYNPLEPPYLSARELLNGEYAQERKPCEAFIHPLECAPNQMAVDEYVVRSGPPPENADLRFYDLGTLNVATGGNTTNGKLGDLWITFQAECFQPKLNMDAGAHADNFSFTTAALTPFGASQNKAGNLGGDIFDGTRYAFPTHFSAGQFLWTYYSHAAAAVTLANINAYFFNGFTHCEALTSIVPANADSTDRFIAWGVIRITGPEAQVTVPNNMTLPVGVDGNFCVSVLPDTFFVPVTTIADVVRAIPKDSDVSPNENKQIEFDPIDLQKFLKFMEALEKTGEQDK